MVLQVNGGSALVLSEVGGRSERREGLGASLGHCPESFTEEAAPELALEFNRLLSSKDS